MLVDGSAGHDDDATAAEVAAAAEVVGSAAAASASVVPLPGIMLALSDGEQLRLALLDILDGMERAIELLPDDDGFRLAFSVMSWPLRARLGLDPPARLAA